MWLCRSATMASSGALPARSVLLNGRASAVAKPISHKPSDFLSWMKDRGEDTACFSVDIGKSEHGRALFAFRPICAGECMMKFSQDLVLIPEKLPKDAFDILKTTNEFSRLSLLILAEKHKGHRSAWAPYIHCLPSSHQVNNTIFWDKEELDCLKCSPVHRETLGRDAMLSSEFDLIGNVLESYPSVFGDVRLDDFRLAYATVSSRAWGGGPHSDLTMIPFVDFANHSPKVHTIFEHNSDENSTMVVADRDYEIGDEVHISYGSHSNCLLAVDFGFCVSDNPFEEAEIWMEIPLEDPLRERKLNMLVQNNMNTVRDPDGSESGRMPFFIEAAYENGEILPPAALAFSRVICSNSSQDLDALIDEATALGVPLAFKPRKDSSVEARAMQKLAAAIELHINDHVEAIQALSGAEIWRGPERRVMAEILLCGELRLLRKAAEWLKSRSM